jgi:hypothetical protein
MKVRRPARLTFAMLNRVLRDNPPLAGDLLEEFNSGRSQSWLLVQVMAAALYRLKPTWATLFQTINTEVLGAGLIVLISFEVVLVTNVFRRIVFGPPLPPINGYLEFVNRQRVPSVDVIRHASTAAWSLPLALSIVLSLAIGLIASRYHYRHRTLALVFLAASVFLLASSNVALAFAPQLLITTVFIIGLIAGGGAFASGPRPGSRYVVSDAE